MEWLSSAETKAAKEAENRKKYSKVKIKDMQISDEIDDITKVAIAVVYKLRDMYSYSETLKWLDSNCKINSCYIRDMKIGQRVLLIRKYIEIFGA